MQDLVLVQPLGLQHFIMRDLVWVVIREEWQHVVIFDIGIVVVGCKTILVLPLVVVHAEHEGPATDFLLGLLTHRYVVPPRLQKMVVRVRDEVILLKESTARQFLDLGRLRLHIIDIVFLLFASIFKYLVRCQVIWELSQGIVIPRPKTPLYQIPFLICIIIKH